MAGRHRKPTPRRRLRVPDPCALLAVLAVAGVALIGTATPEPAIADTSLYVEAAEAAPEPPPTFRCAPLDVETPRVLPAPTARTVDTARSYSTGQNKKKKSKDKKRDGDW